MTTEIIASPEVSEKGGLPNATQRRLAVLAIIFVAIDLRPAIVSIGPILPSIRKEFGLSHATASLLTAIPDLLMGSLALPTSWLARRFGRDRVFLISLALLCISTAARAFSPNTTLLLTSTAGAGMGIAVAGSLIAGFIKANFPSKAAFVIGIYATFLSVGSTISAAITGPLSDTAPGGWRFATGVWSALGVLAIAAWAIATTPGSRRNALLAPLPPARRVTLPVRNKTAWFVAIFFAFNNFLFYAILAWLAPMFREYGASQTKAGLILACFTIAFLCGNPVFGSLSKSQDRRRWLAASAILSSAGLIALAIVPNLAPFIWIAVSAFGLGGAFTLGMTLPLDNTHSVEQANVWNAFVMTVGYLFAAGGPLMVGVTRDLTGSFRLPVWLLVVASVAMLTLTPLLQPSCDEL